MKAVFQKSVLKEGASVSLPSSKSLSHRALITASLAEGVSHINGIVSSRDIEATVHAMEKLGARFELNENMITVTGTGRNLHYGGSVVDCGESGSTLRFLIPLFALQKEEVKFTGHGKLMERPQTVYEQLFRDNGLLFEKKEELLHVRGPLSGGTYTIRGDISSQFITGLMMALPLCSKDSVIHVLPPFESASYVGLTMDALKRAGIQETMEGNDIHIPGGQNYHCFDTAVEGDDSQMAFFAEMALIHGCSVEVKNVSHHSRQGDHVITDLIQQFGGKTEEIPDGYRFTGGQLHAIHADLSDCPDLGPALFALATQAEGTSVFTGCGRLRIKESDRISCMEEELRKLGCVIESEGDTVRVTGKTEIRDNAVLNGHNDHRIVMALSVLASCTDGCVMEGAEAVSKSYPGFFEDFAACGMKVKLI